MCALWNFGLAGWCLYPLARGCRAPRPAFTLFSTLTRAREAGRRDAIRSTRPARSAWSVQRQPAAGFDGEVAGGAVAGSF